MNRTTILKTGLLVIFLIAVVCVFLPNNTQAVTVGPAKLEYFVDPGTVINGEMFLKNEESTIKTFYPSFETFTEQDGQKVFIKDGVSLSTWVTVAKSVTLEAGQDTRIPFTVTIPRDAPPGGHFAVAWWSTAPPATSTEQQVTIQTRAGILMYLNVSGDIHEKASILSFGAEGGKKVFDGPIKKYELTLVDEGNTYIKPQGSITLTSLFGRVRQDIPLNPKGLQILPGSKRAFNDLITDGKGFFIGPYKLNAEVIYGKSGLKVYSTMWVWIIPWKIILVALAVLIVLAIGIPWLLRKYNRWVINKYTNGAKK